MKNIVAAIIFACMLTGCASVIKGTSQAVTFNSEPEGADVLIDGASRGVTPLVVTLKKNKYSTIMFKKAGYKTVTLPLQKSYDGIALLNVFWDSSTTDLVTGAIYEYEPNSYHAALVKDSEGKSDSK